ncbi:MAG TPA: ribonuclease HII [Lachnospiraceae bacterium]|nr:ribonuclease HII [Lachnospiraceae bacterium]
MAKPVSKIRDEFTRADIQTRKELFKLYADDGRKGVQQLIAKFKREEEKLNAELKRLETMKVFEKKYSSYKLIAGIDEAGRGPLAGPVAAGAVILPENCRILYLNDSKKLSASKRDELFDEIKEKAVAYGVGIVSPERIDEINILQATLEAMEKAVKAMDIEPDMLLIDALTIPALPYKQTGIVKGDAKSVSIAAASIIAKVTRDRIMMDIDKIYPEYGFASHKGYGSKAHIEALKKYGPCPVHRKTFIKNFI